MKQNVYPEMHEIRTHPFPRHALRRYRDTAQYSASGAILLFLLVTASFAQGPDKILGIGGGAYGEYDPSVAVDAGLPDQSGATGKCLTTDGSATSWGECGGGGAALSDNTPEDLGRAAAGTGTEGSRDDHVHKRPDEIATNTATATAALVLARRKPDLQNSGTPLPANTTGALGTGTKASREDHIHTWDGYGTGIKDVGTTHTAGVLDKVARVDHVHASNRLVSDPKGEGVATGYVLTVTDATQGSYNWVSGGGARRVLPPLTGQAGNYLRVSSNEKATEWHAVAGGGGASNFTALGDTPNDYTGSAGKVVRVKSDASGLEFATASGGCTRCVSDPEAAGVKVGDVLTVAGVDAYGWKTPAPDLTDEVEDNAAGIEALDFLTQDLIAGTPASGWATETDATNAGIALFTGAATCQSARAATYTPTVGSAGTKYPVVRVKAGFALANVRTLIKGQQTAVDLVSGWPLLCTSADGNHAFYHAAYDGTPEAYGTGVSTVEVQTTGGAHIGTSKYQGDPTKVERWAISGNATDIPISKTLPSITGHSGRVLTVNSEATGVEWKAAAGGGGSGGLTVTSILTGNLVAIDNGFIRDVDGGTCEANRLYYIAVLGSSYEEGAILQPEDAAEFVIVHGVSPQSITLKLSRKLNGVCRINGYNYKGNGAINIKFTLYSISAGASSGGSSGPSIPTPTTAGALQHLRVNAAGAAYELTSPYSTAAPKPPASAAATGTAQTLARSDHVHQLPAIPAGSTDLPEADSANGSAGSSNQWSPSDHSHPITDHDSVTWTNAQVTTLTGGGASGGVDCDGSASYPTAAECKSLVDNFRAGNYNFFILRVARFDDNDNNEPLHISGCSLFPGIPSAIFDGSVVAQASCTANSGKNSANTFHQYDVFVEFGNTGSYVQVRLPNYNSYGVDDVTVTLTGVR